MKHLTIWGCLLFLLIAISWRSTDNETVNYKCLIQLTNYGGEGAYVVASLINPEGEYEKTLFVNGDDSEWYLDIPVWFTFYNFRKKTIDGITGASIQSGGRAVIPLEIDTEKLNKGYTLRFESSVEDGEYHEQDLNVSLSDELNGKTLEGQGYIRHVRIISK